MPLSISINNTLIIDGSEFVRIYNENAPSFDIERIKGILTPKKVDDNYFTCFGYKINIKSTIYSGAKSDDLIEGWNKIVGFDKYQDIFESFFEIEIYNYCRMLSGLGAYLFPILEFLKLSYWYHRASKILGSPVKLLQIKKEILGKAVLLNKYPKASQSINAYEDLLDTQSDFYSEMMFAVLGQQSHHNISMNKKSDFLIDNIVAEVKSIHDEFDSKNLDADLNPILGMSLPNSCGIKDLKDIICTQVMRDKWKSHLGKAIRKQRAKIIFFNATHSQPLQRVSIYVEEKKLRKSFDEMLGPSLASMNNVDSIPVLVMLEMMHQYHITTFFSFLVPVRNKNTNPELDLSRYTVDYIVNSILI